jgi:hypothetical protein
MGETRDRSNFIKRFVDDVKIAVSEPDFWPMVALFFGFMAIFGTFFWLATGFDALAQIYSRWRGACRKLGDWQSLFMFVSPFAIGLSSIVAAGELISQLERKNRYGRPMRWAKILWTFGLAIAMLSAVAVFTTMWC